MVVMMRSITSVLDELSGLLEEDGLFTCPRLPYAKPSIVTRKVEPSDPSSLDKLAPKLDMKETSLEKWRKEKAPPVEGFIHQEVTANPQHCSSRVTSR